MNIVGKYVRRIRQIQLFPFNILKHQSIVQNHVFSTAHLPLFNILSSYKTKRQVSYSSQTDLSNLIDTDDVLMTSIRTAKRTSDVLEMLRLHNHVMNSPQHLQALNSIFNLQKCHRTNQSNEEITRSPEFTALCNKIQNNSRNIELNDLLNSVKCLSYLGISVNSNIMQMQLQLISKMVNDMSLQQIIFLHFLLKDLMVCPLVSALKIALPIVFEIQVKYKLEENIFWILEYLNYVTKHQLSQETFDFLVSKINNNFDQLQPKMVKSILLNLYHIHYSTGKYVDLINRCLHIYINNMEHTTSISEIEALLNRMITKYLSDSEVFYNENFINSIIIHLIEKNESYENMCFIMKKLNKIGFVHRGLLDYVTDQMSYNPEIVAKSKFGALLSFIAACANANYVPPGFIELKSHILKRFDVQKDILELPWLLVTFDLAVLNCWSSDLLERVFSREFLFGFLKRSENVHDYIMLLRLYQAAITLYPDGYKGILPPTEIIEKAIDIYRQQINEFPLKAALEHGLGGSDYVLTGIHSKLGHFIDYVVVMRPGGYPVSIQNIIKDDKSKLLLENIAESTDNLVIGITLHKRYNYVINLNCLRGPYVMTNKTLESLGIALLPVSMDVWDGLMDYEKIPYIMRELKSKTDVDFMTQKNIVH